ncbi:hypothetical protein AAG614_11800 [Citromicrobium bathyomarinum]
MPRKLKPDSPFRYFSFWPDVKHEGENLVSFSAKIRNKDEALTFVKKTLLRLNNVRFRWLPIP